jgi:hypothetical protein
MESSIDDNLLGCDFPKFLVEAYCTKEQYNRKNLDISLGPWDVSLS